MPSATDKAVLSFVTRLSDGPNVAADSVAGLVLRLLGRVGRLEQAVQQHDKKFEALAKQPAMRARTHDAAPQTIVKSGIDCYGVPEVITERVRRPKGRPPGARDHTPRARRKPAVAFKDIETQLIGPLAAQLLDPDFDDR
jgi:hypothetical protein